MGKTKPLIDGIPLKKQFGQHFLNNEQFVEHMCDNVTLTQQTPVFEIGCGYGILTHAILQRDIKKLWVFEIDQDWADLVGRKYGDNPKLTICQENILQVHPDRFSGTGPWVVLANLPYNITFPILHLFHTIRAHITEGVIMVQEEVAQKILKTTGRGYGYPSLFFQHYFTWKKLDKIPPTAFYPPPKVDSRLLYFKPRTDMPEIPEEKDFWKFIKLCFRQPRRTLKNNLQQSHFSLALLTDEILAKRAQQLTMEDFLYIWRIFLQGL